MRLSIVEIEIKNAEKSVPKWRWKRRVDTNAITCTLFSRVNSSDILFQMYVLCGFKRTGCIWLASTFHKYSDGQHISQRTKRVKFIWYKGICFASLSLRVTVKYKICIHMDSYSDKGFDIFFIQCFFVIMNLFIYLQKIGSGLLILHHSNFALQLTNKRHFVS